jgi:hypothetical protein
MHPRDQAHKKQWTWNASCFSFSSSLSVQCKPSRYYSLLDKCFRSSLWLVFWKAPPSPQTREAPTPPTETSTNQANAALTQHQEKWTNFSARIIFSKWKCFRLLLQLLEGSSTNSSSRQKQSSQDGLLAVSSVALYICAVGRGICADWLAWKNDVRNVTLKIADPAGSKSHTKSL